MTRTEMIAFIRENPNVPIAHSLFAHDEFIVSHEDGNVYDESGYLFENWYSPNNFSGWNGIRMRSGGQWEDGWYIKDDFRSRIIIHPWDSRSPESVLGKFI